VVKKYRDALENVIGATMEFLAQVPAQDPALTTSPQTHATPQPVDIASFSSSFTSAAQESYVRGSPKSGEYTTALKDSSSEADPAFGYMPETQTSPASAGRWEGRHGELGQMDAEWLLSLCEGDGFNLQMLNEMMRFEPSLGA